MLLTLLKIALVAFIVIGVTIIVVVYVLNVRKLPAGREGPDPNLGPSTTTGAVAPTPLPEWAYWDDTDDNYKDDNYRDDGKKRQAGQA